MVLWGSSFIALKVAVNEMAPMIVVFMRMAIGSLGFLLAWPWLRQSFHYQSGDWKYLVGMALFEPCFYFIFEAQGLLYTSAGQAGMVTAMLPLMVAIAAFFFLGERSTIRQWLGFLVAVSGVICMTVSGQETDQAPNAVLGNFLQFLAMVCAVGFTLLVKHLTRRYSALLLTAMQTFIGALFFLPLALLSDWPTTVSLPVIGILFYLGLIITLGTYGLYGYALTHLKASIAAGYTNLLPVFTLLFSMLVLGERLVFFQWLSIGIIFIGVLLSQEQASSSVKLTQDVPPTITG